MQTTPLSIWLFTKTQHKQRPPLLNTPLSGLPTTLWSSTLIKRWLSSFLLIMFRHIRKNPVIFENASLNPANVMKFLSIKINEHLTFIPHVNLTMKNCNCNLCWMDGLTGQRAQGQQKLKNVCDLCREYFV